MLDFKLKALKENLKVWSKTLQGNLGLQKQSILNQMAALEEIRDQRCLNDDENYLKATLEVEFEYIAKKVEVT